MSTELEQMVIEPVFGTDAVALVFAANDFYVPYLSALLQSVVDHASDERDYDIVVLTADISEANQIILREQVQTPYVSLRFFDMTPFLSMCEGLYLRGHFRIETYYRLALQDVMPDYHKVLYLDSDMIVLDDVAEAYDTDVTGYLVAAVHDADTAGLYNGYLPDKKNYIDNVLELRDPYGYFQAGVLLLNLDEFRNSYTVDELFAYSGSYEWELLDQDVLNHFCEGRIKYLDMRWNVMMDMEGIRASDIIGLAPAEFQQAYTEARKDPAIIHYAGPEKPWFDPECDFADYFWFYSGLTPYYEVALTRLQEEVQRRAQAIIEEKARWKALPLYVRLKEHAYRGYLKLFPEDSRRGSLVNNLRKKV